MEGHPLPSRQPDSAHHDPRPEYLRALLEQAGVSQREAARRIGISERTLRYYVSDPASGDYRAAPYPVQYAIEHLSDE
ncbi:MAG: helix-turn-helix domain-containing protein [Pseudomonas sp.]